jgi:hypothetical protein
MISENDVDKIGGKILTEFFCHVCKYISDNKQDLYKHVTAQTPTEKLSESEAPQPAHESGETEEVSVQNMNDQLKYNCGKCIFSSEDTDKLNDQIDNLHNATETLKCEKCEIECTGERQLIKHIQDVHELEASKVHKCKKCEFQSVNISKLNEHRQVDHMVVKINIGKAEQFIIKCDQCDYKCRLNIQLKKHIDVKHMVKASGKYNCKECGYVSEFIADAWNHTLAKHPDKSYEFNKDETENMILKIVADSYN